MREKTKERKRERERDKKQSIAVSVKKIKRGREKNEKNQAADFSFTLSLCSRLNSVKKRKNSSPPFSPARSVSRPPTMRGARSLAGARPTVAVAGGAKLANKQAARPAAPQMLGSSAARTSADAAAANVKVAAIKPPASSSPAQTYANDEAPLKLSIGEAPGMGESSVSSMEKRGGGASGESCKKCLSEI